MLYPGCRVRVINTHQVQYRYLIGSEGVVIERANQDGSWEYKKYGVTMRVKLDNIDGLLIFIADHLRPILPPFVPSIEELLEINPELLQEAECPLFHEVEK